MKCPVCGTQYSASMCSLCGYEDILIVGLSEDEARRELHKQITRGKKDFLSKVQVGIVLYQYDVNEETASETEERVTVLSRLAADGKIYWLPRKFKFDLTREYVETEVFVKIAGTDREFLHRAELRNLMGEEEQEVGLQIDENLQFRVNVRMNGKQTSSQPQYLFA